LFCFKALLCVWKVKNHIFFIWTCVTFGHWSFHKCNWKGINLVHGFGVLIDCETYVEKSDIWHLWRNRHSSGISLFRICSHKHIELSEMF
jgi:hypothetical protein